MKSWRVLIIPILFLLSCSFENDQLFVPQTKRAFLLLEDTASGQKRICEVLDNKLDCNVNLDPFWSIEEPIIDMSGFDEWLYVITAGSKLYKINLSQQERWVITIADAVPSSIVAGEKYLLMGDSTNNQLIFAEKKESSTSTFIQKTAGVPQRAIYRSGKFFVLLDSTTMAAYHETGFSLLGTLEANQAIVDFHANNRTSVLLLMRSGGEWSLGGMDWNNYQWNIPPSQTPVRLFRTTPYFRSAYEKEWLRDVQVDTTRRLFLTKNIRGMEVDFFESNVYFLSNDTLERFNIRSRELTDLGAVEEEIAGSYFHIENPD